MKKAICCCLLLLFSPLFLRAQVANNTALVGTVTDAAGALVTGAHVTGINRDTKVNYSGETNAEGFYSIPFVLPGPYDVVVEKPGFSKTVSSGVQVQLNVAVRTDVALKIGSDTSEVTVSASTAALSTDDALLGETIGTAKVENLPLNTRRVMDLAATASNIIIGPKTSFTGNPPGANYIGAGTREVTNSLTLDGITIMNSLGSSSPVTPNPDAIGAVQTQNGNYTAQYGAYMGVHINMDTKSGTNKFHGTAYDYVQNDFFNAKNWLSAKGARTPVLRFNQFGGVLNGPIVIPHFFNGRDKAFFLASYEGLRQISQQQTTATVPTAAMLAGNFAAVARQLVNPATGAAYVNNQITNISPIAAKLAAYYPAATNQNAITNNYNGTSPLNLSQNQTLDRVDYNLGEKIRFFVRYDWQKLTTVNGSIVPTSNSYSPTTSSNAAFGYTHIITPNLINDFRFGYNKLSTNLLNYFAQNGILGTTTALGIPNFSDAGNPGLPTILVTGAQALGADGTNWYQDDRTLHGYDQISYTWRKHTIMAGADIRRMTIGRAAQNTPRGSFNFTGNYSGNAFADFLTGYSQTVVTPITQVKGSVAEWRDGFFVQDNWQITQKLTLLYGVRYELPTVPYSLNGNARIINQSYTALIAPSSATTGATFVPTPGLKFTGPNHDLVAPRFGFAYRATDKIVVRGGGGFYYNPNHLNSFTLATGNYPLANSFTYNGAASGIANLSFTNPTGTGAPSTSCVPGNLGCYTSVFNDNYYLPTPRLYQWNLDTGVELWRNAAFELQYLGSHGIHLDRSDYVNQPTPGAGNVNARRPNQLFGQIRQIQNDGISTYEGLTAIFRQRVTHGLDMNLGYTWAKSLDTSSDSNGGGTPMIQNNLKADYGSSNWDIRNRFVGTITYALPNFNRFNPTVREVIGGWQANAIVTLQTGMPFNVAISNDIANVGQGTQRPNYVHAGKATCSRQTVIQGISCIDPSAYVLPVTSTTQYAFGNVHRNDLFGPGYANTNLSLFKNFRIFDSVSAQFRAEAFNLFNHPNPGNPNVTLGTVGTSTTNPTRYNTNANGSSVFAANNFGTITTVQGASRVLQLAGKINF